MADPIINGPKLAPTVAYKAMFEFLMQYARRTQSEDIQALLGDLSLLPDGTPADPAMYSDWVAAIATVDKAERSGGYDPIRLRLR